MQLSTQANFSDRRKSVWRPPCPLPKQSPYHSHKRTDITIPACCFITSLSSTSHVMSICFMKLRKRQLASILASLLGLLKALEQCGQHIRSWCLLLSDCLPFLACSAPSSPYSLP